MLAYLFVVLAAAVHIRWVALPFSFTPVVAALLYFGARMPRKQMWVPLAILAASDIYLNRVVYNYPLHADQVVTWALYAGILLLGASVIKGWSATRIGLSALSGSVGFFLISNAAVWLDGTMYPMTGKGLQTCLIAGLPFFRNAFISDMLFTAAFFGIGYLVSLRHADEVAIAVAERTR